MNLLTATIFYFAYEDARKNLDASLLLEMKLCSLNLQCDRFAIDFEPLETKALYTLGAEGVRGPHCFRFPEATGTR